MKYSDYCNIHNLDFSQDSVTYLRELEEIGALGNVIATFNAAATFKTIFADRSYHKVVKNITTSDWEEFGKTMININGMARNAALLVTDKGYEKTTGKEKEFWRCMTNALR